MRIWVAAMAAAILALCLAVSATAGPVSCDELQDLQDRLMDLEQSLQSDGLGRIAKDREAVDALRQLMEDLSQVAAGESDLNLSDSVEGMSQAWQDKDGDLLLQSVGDASNSVYDIYQRDCY